MLTITPAFKAGAGITFVVLIGSVVLDITNLIGWSWIDSATVVLTLSTLLMLLFTMLAGVTLPDPAGFVESASEMHERTIAGGLTGGQAHGHQWSWVVVAIIPGITAIILFSVF